MYRCHCNSNLFVRLLFWHFSLLPLHLPLPEPQSVILFLKILPPRVLGGVEGDRGDGELQETLQLHEIRVFGPGEGSSTGVQKLL